MLPVEQPFKTYTGLDGKPLDNGYVYFGLPDQDPTTHPVTVYWDAAGTLPAAQPLRTLSGYIMNGGSPANVFFDDSYSVLVKDAKGRQVFYANSSDDFSIATVVANFLTTLASSGGASKIGFKMAGAGSVDRTVEQKLRESSVSLADKGASLDSLDNSAALLKAVNSGASVYVPDGNWKVASGTPLPAGAFIWGPGTIERTTAGPIFTASGKSDITIRGVGFKGNKDSWALQFDGCTKVRLAHNRCTDIMLVQTNSLTGAYATTTDDNMSRDVTVYDNHGICAAVPTAQSQQFIRILYTRDFTVALNSARGYRELVLAWGGDYVADGAAANQRKCYDGLIEGNRGQVLAAGIWTAMAKDVRVIGNELKGNANAEGLDAEGSTNVTFDSNDALNFADGLAAFGLNRNVKFWNNNVTASAYAFRNANGAFNADYGLLEFDGNTFASTTAACIGWVTGGAERVRLTNNRFENVALTLTDVAAAEIVLMENELYFDYAPAGLWLVRLGGLTNGYTKQPKKSIIKVKLNTVEWRGAGILNKRAFGLTSSDVAHTIDFQQNTCIGIDEQLSYEGSVGAMTVLSKRNTFDAAATYPSVLHGSSAGLTVIWQDNDRSDGLDAYGTNAPTAPTFFSPGSRIWSNTPANGQPPGWVYRTGVWGPMAVIG